MTGLGEQAAHRSLWRAPLVCEQWLQPRNPLPARAPVILGSANLVTAAVCRITSQQPANVCANPGHPANPSIDRRKQ